MGYIKATLYWGDIFNDAVAPLIPFDDTHLPALWAFASSDEFLPAVRLVNQKVNVTPGSFHEVEFDIARWQSIANEKYPNGLPSPHSDDPTQWLFNGSVTRCTQPLHVAVGRLLRFRWPEQFEDLAAVDTLTDADGITCLNPLRGEDPSGQRLLELLKAVYGTNWSDTLLHDLLTALGCRAGTSLEDWLRNSFFEQHCKLFQNRPFIWQIWDGRKDGFSCLVNYHKLNHKTLENLAYSYLGDWIKAQNAEAKAEKPGADLRLAAAQALQEKLKLILAGEPPYDVFVRWKPLHEQAIGWHPDVDDGVRMNIRPFVEADILRKKPNIKWTKDRGKEPEREKVDFPWFWDGKDFVGDRVNDVHLTNAEKQEARTRARKK